MFYPNLFLLLFKMAVSISLCLHPLLSLTYTRISSICQFALVLCIHNPRWTVEGMYANSKGKLKIFLVNSISCGVRCTPQRWSSKSKGLCKLKNPNLISPSFYLFPRQGLSPPPPTPPLLINCQIIENTTLRTLALWRCGRPWQPEFLKYIFCKLAWITNKGGYREALPTV